MAARNGDPLQQAVAILIQNQAHFLAAQARTDERFLRIEAKLDAIERILLRHDQVLADLPEAIRRKVGFKAGR
ncbi:MAG: hypothetical protein HYX74_10765 [Acidobacteria bacterium]|nr:hypothetical protein [Acidobacteriota bacterium]